MRPRTIIRTVITLAVIFAAWSASTQYNKEYFFYMGRRFMMDNKYQDAINTLNVLLRFDEDAYEGYFLRGIAKYNLDDLLGADADFTIAIEKNPVFTNAYTYRAIIRSQIGDYNNALSDYDRVAEYSPNNVLVYYNRANLYTQVGEIENAVQDYTKAISLYPDFANAYLNRSYLKFLLNDPAGARSDRQTAERKIAEYRSRLSDSTYSIYADTTQKFDKLLSFDAKMAGDTFETTAMNSNEAGPKLLPMFKFTLMYPDSAIMARDEIYYAQRAEDFKQKIGNPLLILSRDESNIAPDSLVAMDRALLDTLRTQDPSWVLLFQRGVTQSLIKQYTNAVNTLSLAIADNPSNPFLYINRSTTRAEMIDFISSIDNTYQRISIDSDPANRLRNAGSRTYDYNDAIEDINNAIKLYPTFAYSYYNRACLNAISGHLPEAYDDYTKAIELNPDFGEAYYNRGLVQIFMKDTRKGCLDLSKAGELGIENAYEALKYYTAGTIDQ